MEELGEPGYRSRQLLEAIYRQRVETPEQISTLPTPLRGKLAEMGFVIGLPQIEKQFVPGRHGALSHGIFRRPERRNRMDA